MRGKQVGVVLIALLVVAMAGLIVRVISSAEDELVLKGLLPLSEEQITRVTISSDESQADLVRIGTVWSVRRQQVFIPKLTQFWAAVEQINKAGLIATKESTHNRMGITNELGTKVSFFLGEALQEQLIVGDWSPESRLCYVRRAGKATVYGIECPVPAVSIFDPDPDGWRNPVIAAIPPNEVESVTFSYPGEDFVLRIDRGGWLVSDGVQELEANPFLVQAILRNFEFLLATGFADDEEAESLRFDAASPSLRVTTREGAINPTTRFTFLQREDGSYYVRTQSQPTVFIIEGALAEVLLQHKEAFGLGSGG